MQTLRLAGRTWLRYAAPLGVLGIVACTPLLYAVLKLAPAIDVPHARNRLGIGVALALAAYAAQLALVAAAAPAARAIARGEKLGQLAVFRHGAAQLARAAVPVLAALCTIGLGAAALVVPGAILLVLLALVGASDRLAEPLPAALADSVAAARAAFWPLAALVVAAIAIDLAVADGGQLVLFGGPKKPTPDVLAALKITLVPLAGLALVSAPIACALAAVAGKPR